MIPGIDEFRKESGGGKTLNLTETAYTMAEEADIDFPEQKIILGDWLMSDSINMIHGGTGFGKTWLVLGVALTLATGTEFIPGWKFNGEPMNVLLVDGEMSPDDLKSRKAALVKGVEISAKVKTLTTISNIYRTQKSQGMIDLTKEHDREELESFIEKNSFQFVCLDNLSCLIPGVNIKASEEYSPFNTWLIRMRGKGVMMMFVHHDNKKEDFTGANEMTFQLHSRLHVKKDGDGFKVHQAKNRGQKGSDITLSVENDWSGGLVLAEKRQKKTALQSAMLYLRNNEFAEKEDITSYLVESGHTDNAIQKMFITQKGNKSGKRIYCEKGKYFVRD